MTIESIQYQKFSNMFSWVAYLLQFSSTIQIVIQILQQVWFSLISSHPPQILTLLLNHGEEATYGNKFMKYDSHHCLIDNLVSHCYTINVVLVNGFFKCYMTDDAIAMIFPFIWWHNSSEKTKEWIDNQYILCFSSFIFNSLLFITCVHTIVDVLSYLSYG